MPAERMKPNTDAARYRIPISRVGTRPILFMTSAGVTDAMSAELMAGVNLGVIWVALEITV